MRARREGLGSRAVGQGAGGAVERPAPAPRRPRPERAPTSTRRARPRAARKGPPRPRPAPVSGATPAVRARPGRTAKTPPDAKVQAQAPAPNALWRKGPPPGARGSGVQAVKALRSVARDGPSARKARKGSALKGALPLEARGLASPLAPYIAVAPRGPSPAKKMAPAEPAGEITGGAPTNGAPPPLKGWQRRKGPPREPGKEVGQNPFRTGGPGAPRGPSARRKESAIGGAVPSSAAPAKGRYANALCGNPLLAPPALASKGRGAARIGLGRSRGEGDLSAATVDPKGPTPCAYPAPWDPPAGRA